MSESNGTNLAEGQGGNEQSQNAHEQPNIFSMLKQMGNSTITSPKDAQISELTKTINSMHDAMAMMKQDIVSLSQKRQYDGKTDDVTPQKRIKIVDAQDNVSCYGDSGSDDEIDSFLAEQNEAPQGDCTDTEWSEISDFFEDNLDTGDEILPDLANLANSVLRAKPKDEKVTCLKNKYKRPKNVENLQVTKVDEQLWRQLRRETKTFDFAMQKNQLTLCHAIVPTLRLMQNLKEKGPTAEAKELVADTFKILAYGINQSNDARRERIKKDLLPGYKSLCNQPSSASKLFGDKLQEEIKHLKDTKTHLTSAKQPFLSKRRGGHSSYSYNNQHNQFRAQGTAAYPPRNNKPWNTGLHRQHNQAKKEKMGRK